MSAKVTVNKSGWNRLKKHLLKQAQSEVRVGWFQDQRYGPENGNLQMAQVANWNEFGGINGPDSQFPGARTPARPFMRVWYKDFLKEDDGVMLGMKLLAATAFSRGDVGQALGLIGPVGRTALQETMMRFDDPLNSPATEDLKGFNDPLYETGQLIMNVDFRVSKKGGE